MCGIFGYAKRQNAQNDNQLEVIKKVLTNLADESVVRGTDSTGISMINPASRRTFKATAPSSEVITDDSWESNILDRVDRNNTIAIGHVRLATHGVVNSRNAHPFEIGNVIGAHNGIIYNYNKLAKKYNKSIEVDSEIIFESLNLNSKKKALEELEGDFAISWIRDSNRIVHLARESSRPLSVAYWKKAKTLIWASTDEILKKSLKRAGLNLKQVSLKSEIIYSFNTDKFDTKYNPSRIEFEAKEKEVISYTGSHYTDWSYTSGYYDNYNDSYAKVDSDENEEIKDDISCAMCLQGFSNEEVIEIETDTDVCWDCMDNLDECQWCGDYMFFGEGTSFNRWRVCDSCKPSAASNLLLEETCSIN